MQMSKMWKTKNDYYISNVLLILSVPPLLRKLAQSKGSLPLSNDTKKQLLQKVKVIKAVTSK